MPQVEAREPLASQENTGLGSRIPRSASKLKPPDSFRKPQLSGMKPPPMPDLNVKKRPGGQAGAPASKRPRLDKSVDDNFTGRVPSKPTNAVLSGRPSTIASRAISGRAVAAGTQSARPTRSSMIKSTSGSSLNRSSGPTMSKSNSAGTLNRPGSGATTRTTGKPPTAAKSTVPTAADAGPKGKRAAWDLRGRLQDLEKLVFDKSHQLKGASEQLSQVSEIKQELETEITNRQQHNHELQAKLSTVEKNLRDTEDEYRETKRRLERDLEDANSDKSRVERQRDTLDGELKAAMTQVAGLKTTVAELTAAQSGIQSQYEGAKMHLEASQTLNKQRAEEIAELKQMLKEKEETIDELNSKARSHETERRRLHNTIQELKGNIRVFCRVRPYIPSELASLDDSTPYHIQYPDEDSKAIELDNLASKKLDDTKQNRHLFKFDHVFKPTSCQDEVFQEISQLVQSALDGYNVCIFAYGQTGSGKTYTMEGPDRPDDVTEGMIPRAVKQIFLAAETLVENGWKYEFEASFLEIYNETLRDLLGNGDPKTKHDIKLVNSKTNELTVTNQTLVNVTSPEQVASLLHKASENRAVAETKMNERSSRSHSVFTLKLRGNNSVTTEACEGTLNLVDLAGSERLKDSGSQGARLKETQAINSSLSNLGNVIMALANKESHIPYRNSKLTYLLQNSLGGNSKTLMFVNVSPREEHLSETVNSLRFAAKVNSCNIGTAQRKTK